MTSLEDTPCITSYSNTQIFRTAVVSSICCLTAFVILFFADKGPGDQWPYHWWSFCFLGFAIFLFYVLTKHKPSKIELRRIDNKVEEYCLDFYNCYGQIIQNESFSAIASVEVCYCKIVCITWTEEAYEERKGAAPSLLRYFVFHSQRVDLADDAERFAQDYQKYGATKQVDIETPTDDN